MRQYLARTCPQCGDDLRINLPRSAPRANERPVLGDCSTCGYRLSWKVIRGRNGAPSLRIGGAVILVITCVFLTTLALRRR